MVKSHHVQTEPRATDYKDVRSYTVLFFVLSKRPVYSELNLFRQQWAHQRRLCTILDEESSHGTYVFVSVGQNPVHLLRVRDQHDQKYYITLPRYYFLQLFQIAINQKLSEYVK